MKNKYAIFLIFSLIPIFANAQIVDIVHQALSSATASANGKIEKQAMTLLSSLVFAQFLITQFGSLTSLSDLQDIWKRFIVGLGWFGFCFYIMLNGSGFINSQFDIVMKIAGSVSGAGQFSTSYLFDYGINIAAGLLAAVDKAKGADGFLAALDFLPSILTGVTCFMILATSCLIGFKIFLVKIEILLVIMLAPLSFAFLGINAFKENGLAPFRALISLTYRVLLLAVIVSAMGEVGKSIQTVLAAVDPGKVMDIWKPIFSSLFGYFLLGYLAYSSDKISANLASGGTSMGTNDAAAAVAIGNEVSKAMTDVMKSTAGAASGVGKSISEMMKGGGGGSVTNAGSSGRGRDQQPIGEAPERSSSSLMSQGGSAGGSSSGESESGSAAAAAEKSADAAKSGELASAGAQMAGAGAEATVAAGAAAQSGGSSAQIAGAVQAAGGTPAQGVAAAMGAKGAHPQHIDAATKAVSKGAHPTDVGIAVRAAGGSWDNAQAAQEAAKAVAHKPGAGVGGGIGGATSMSETQQEAAKTRDMMEKMRNANVQPKKTRSAAGEALSNLNRMVERENHTTHVSSNLNTPD